MGVPAEWQIAHIEEHLEAFQNHAGDFTPAEYLTQYADYKDGKIYERLCADLGIEPRTGPEEDENPNFDRPVEPDLQNLVNLAVHQAFDETGLPATVQLADVLSSIDPRDSDAALMLLAWLQDTNRLSVVATLAGKGGYMFRYAEPKGSTRQGYVAGGTQGGRMVDAALDQARASGATAREVGICDQCYSAVVQLDDGTIVTDNDAPDAICWASKTRKHTFKG